MRAKIQIRPITESVRSELVELLRPYSLDKAAQRSIEKSPGFFIVEDPLVGPSVGELNDFEGVTVFLT